MSKRVHLFISPHLDDIALSCGGYVRRLTTAGECVIVLTIFAGDLPAGVSPPWLARRYELSWRLGDRPFAARRGEDAAAMQLLGAQYRHLDFLDAIYRRDLVGHPLYTKQSFGVPMRREDSQNYEPLVRLELEDVLQTYKSQDVYVYIPLGAGGHVDHLIVRHAIESERQSEVVVYYEDFPYASQPGVLPGQLCRNGNGVDCEATLIALTADEIDARIDAVGCYASQIPVLFPTPLERAQEVVRARVPGFSRFFDGSIDMNACRERMAAALKSYIARVGGERYWRDGMPVLNNGNTSNEY